VVEVLLDDGEDALAAAASPVARVRAVDPAAVLVPAPAPAAAGTVRLPDDVATLLRGCGRVRAGQPMTDRTAGA
jgi:hypothetical protein